MADVRVWLGQILLSRGHWARAEPLLRQALAYREATLPEGHPKAAEAECGLARAWMGLDRRAEAREAFERCWPRWQSTASPEQLEAARPARDAVLRTG